MRVDNNNGDPSLEPLVDPTSAVEYDDDYEEEREGEAEYGGDVALYAPATDAAERLRGLVAYLATNLVMIRQVSRWRPANAVVASSSASEFRRRNWGRSSVAAAASLAPCAQRS